MTQSGSVRMGRGILDQLPEELRTRGLGEKLFVITDSGAGPVYLERVVDLLTRAGMPVTCIQVPAGEASKSLAQAAALYEWLVQNGAERSDCILALGGGVIGDLAGFVAATYQRGVKWAQVSTTLLAQVDSSIGGKVAIDLPAAKNMVGAFHPASLSFLDTAMLDTLPTRQLVAGWAEVVKTAMVLDADLFEALETRLRDPRDHELLLLAVEKCVAQKSRVVEQDPLDQGPRALVNYGHTIGHALEAVTGYSRYLHGEAVAVGMAGAAAISRRLGMLPEVDEARQNALLERLGLPTQFSGARPDAIDSALSRDKKVRGGQPRWVLVDRIGKGTFGNLAPPAIVREIIARLHSA